MSLCRGELARSRPRRPVLAAGVLALCAAVAGDPASADPGGCRALSIRGVTPPPATLTWKPFLSKKRTLAPSSLLAPPFPTLTAALHAIAKERGERGHRPSAFLVRPFLAGFIVYNYPLPDGPGFALSQVVVAGLPFGGSAEQPEAWLVDGEGRTGSLLRKAGRFRLVELGRDASDKLVPAPASAKSFRLGRDSFLVDEPPAVDAGLPWVVPNGLENVAGDDWTPRWAFRPGLDEAEVGRLLTWLNQQPEPLKVKAGGSRHSWSKVAASNGAYVHPEGMRCLEPAAGDGTLRADLPEAFGNNLFRIGSGTVIREINDTLWERYGKAFGALGGYDGQTLGGVLPTGTHGSILSHGPLAEMVRSLDLVTGTGESLRVEPKDGPTDLAAFALSHPNARLIQEDDVFEAVLIHIGTMGVVRSLVVETRDCFYLTEVRTSEPIDTVLATLGGGGIYHLYEGVKRPLWASPWSGLGFSGHPLPAYHLELLMNPLGEEIIVTSRQPTPLVIEEPPVFRERPERNLFRLHATPQPYRREIGVVWFSENFYEGIGWISQSLMENIPELTPGLVGSAMNGLKNPGYLHRSYRVFNIGDGQNAIPSLSGTIFVPLRDDLYIRAIEIIRRVAREMAPQGIYQTGPISLRFVRGSRALLGNPEDVCAFELIFAGKTKWAREMVQAYDAALREELGTENVRFHWGQLMPGVEKSRVLANYERYEEWRRIRDRFDPARRFINEWQETILP
jgi:hypothetical protein